MFPYELIRLSDDENEVVVTVLAAESPTLWEAEIAVRSMFVSGRTLLMLFPSKFEEWAAALDRLAAGEDIAWMARHNGPTIRVFLDGARDCPDVEVDDESLSMVTVRIPIALEGDWIGDHRARLTRFLAG
ncbi:MULTISPECIES: DUF5959 family protein [Actinoplanes]|uniref:DUF5959 family protein n=1 Tax=Actinoplanes TaxID=1865 RepID=UPI0005F29AD1|nr:MULTISPECIES: DUF5959 family protein [Actinoplanes]GLY01349.1 hypothetical protein Acsp01_17280 [Actinoplanes sp. NBRC 101535]